MKNKISIDKNEDKYEKRRSEAFGRFLGDEISFDEYLEVWDREFEKALGGSSE